MTTVSRTRGVVDRGVRAHCHQHLDTAPQDRVRPSEGLHGRTPDHPSAPRGRGRDADGHPHLVPLIRWPSARPRPSGSSGRSRCCRAADSGRATPGRTCCDTARRARSSPGSMRKAGLSSRSGRSAGATGVRPGVRWRRRRRRWGSTRRSWSPGGSCGLRRWPCTASCCSAPGCASSPPTRPVGRPGVRMRRAPWCSTRRRARRTPT